MSVMDHMPYDQVVSEINRSRRGDANQRALQDAVSLVMQQLNFGRGLGQRQYEFNAGLGYRRGRDVAEDRQWQQDYQLRKQRADLEAGQAAADSELYGATIGPWLRRARMGGADGVYGPPAMQPAPGFEAAGPPTMADAAAGGGDGVDAATFGRASGPAQRHFADSLEAARRGAALEQAINEDVQGGAMHPQIGQHLLGLLQSDPEGAARGYAKWQEGIAEHEMAVAQGADAGPKLREIVAMLEIPKGKQAAAESEIRMVEKGLKSPKEAHDAIVKMAGPPTAETAQRLQRLGGPDAYPGYGEDLVAVRDAGIPINPGAANRTGQGREGAMTSSPEFIRLDRDEKAAKEEYQNWVSNGDPDEITKSRAAYQAARKRMDDFLDARIKRSPRGTPAPRGGEAGGGGDPVERARQIRDELKAAGQLPDDKAAAAKMITDRLTAEGYK